MPNIIAKVCGAPTAVAAGITSAIRAVVDMLSPSPKQNAAEAPVPPPVTAQYG